MNNPHLQNRPDQSTALSVPGAPAWIALLRDVTIKDDGMPRHLPEVVNTAVSRLRQLQERGDNELDRPERSHLILALTDYRDILRAVELTPSQKPEEMATYQGALFSYLDSQRLFADFQRFCVKADLSTSFPKLRDEVFNRDGFGFFYEMRAALRDGPLLSTFVDLVVGNVRSMDRELMGESLKFMGMLYSLGRLNNLKFFVDAHNRHDISGTMLIPVARVLVYCDFIPNKSDRLVLFGLGGETARLSPKNLVGLDHPLRSEPHVEFGYYVQRILDLSYGAPSSESHAELCKLVRLIPEYFVYLDGRILEETIGVIRRAVLTALPKYSNDGAPQLASVASELIQQPWKGEISLLWKACSNRSDASPTSAASLILRAALKNPHTAKELQDELRRRDSAASSTSPNELRDFGENVATLIRSQRFLADDNPIFERALRLLRKSPQTTAALLPELLDIAGVPSISLGSFGVVSLPWSTRPDPRPLIRSLALDLLYDAHLQLGFFARRRLGFT
jgi:hypothetical protein